MEQKLNNNPKIREDTNPIPFLFQNGEALASAS
jgi:hypothetical protein